MRGYIGTFGKQEGRRGILVHFAKQEGYIGTFRRNHSNKSPITVGLPDEGGVYWYISKYEVYWNTPTLGWGILAHFQISSGYIGTRHLGWGILVRHPRY